MPLPRPPDAPCEWCGAPFFNRTKQQRFCSVKCWREQTSLDARTRPSKRCSQCGETKPRSAFSSNRARYDGLQHQCRDCNAAVRRPERQRDWDLQRKYGLTRSELDFQIQVQGGACMICRTQLGSGKEVAIDHDHETNKVRGILCRACNLGLGWFRDDPALLRIAISYLQRAEIAALGNRWYSLDILDGRCEIACS